MGGESINQKTDYYTKLMQDIRIYIHQSGGGDSNRKGTTEIANDEDILGASLTGQKMGIISNDGGGPTTQMLLMEFSAVPDRDAAVFKRLLQTVARSVNGRWQLRP